MQHADLFGATLSLPEGLMYRQDFITREEETVLLAAIRALPLQEARYRQYTARRRTINFGAAYDFQQHRATPAPVLPQFLDPIRERAAEWIGIAPGDFVQTLIAEYQPGTPLGWHRDVPDYEIIFAVSLASACRIRFRRYPWNPAEKKDIFAIEPAPRSAYVLRDDARWKWQHSVPAVQELRYSITLRTLNLRCAKRR
jgi:alkylated DNA repair dioxygenase AlkB